MKTTMLYPGLFLSLALLTACGGGSGSPSLEPMPTEFSPISEKSPADDQSESIDEGASEETGLVDDEEPPPPLYEPTLESLSEHPLPQWWQDAKFGIFIHWGLYSVPAWAPADAPPMMLSSGCAAYAEWYWLLQQIPFCPTWQHHLDTYGEDFVYDDFIPRFTAENFDPDAWIQLFEQAGARYFVLTAKHHDGFALWPTRTTGRDSVDLGPKRDLVGELFDAARRAGQRVKPGLYFSIPEWFNPAPYRGNDFAQSVAESGEFLGYLPNLASLFSGSVRPGVAFEGLVQSAMFPQRWPVQVVARNAYSQLPVPYTGQGDIADYAEDIVQPQFKELVDLYQPYVIWCDIGAEESYVRSNESIAYYYNETARTNPEGVLVTDRCGRKKSTHYDFNTVEYGQGDVVPPFESVRGMGSSFGYNVNETEAHYLSPAELIETLVSTVAAGGNLLLNIGPKADGSIPEEMVTRLQAMGDWLAINGDAIYGSRPWSRTRDDNGNFFTVGKDGALYVIATAWPGHTLTVNAHIPIDDNTQIILLGSDKSALPYTQTGRNLQITMPTTEPKQATASQHVYVFRVDQS
ncbi:alpha-L-fucosidase [Alcanivoracaceae bacterium MT1]